MFTRQRRGAAVVQENIIVNTNIMNAVTLNVKNVSSETRR